MSLEFYTSVCSHGGKILYRGISDGKKVMSRLSYQPTLFLPATNNEIPSHHSIDGVPLVPKEFNSISSAKNFIYQYREISNFTIYGKSKFEYAYISDTFPQDMAFDEKHIQVDIIDIECKSDNGFPEPTIADQEITAITVYRNGLYYIFGIKDYTPSKPTYVYKKCHDENDLIKSFLTFWSAAYPDIITGWNNQTFDLVYLINRIRNLLGEEFIKRLSPWGIVMQKSKMMTFAGRPERVFYYDILGIQTLDYMILFKKLSPYESQESYSLDHIASVVLGEGKVSYEDYGSLKELYEQDHQRFIDYNARDVEIIYEIDNQIKLIRLALILAYDAKCNYEDVFSQVRIWSQICYDHLIHKHNIVMAISHEISSDDNTYQGAYVKVPKPGFKYDIVSIDAKALYPSLIQCLNISPETLVDVDPNCNIDGLLNRTYKPNSEEYSIGGNGARFRKDKKGFFVELIDKYMTRRDVAKSKMIEYQKQKAAGDTNPELDFLIEMYNAQQFSMKIAQNSLYGASGTKYFPFYDERLAKAITLTGQYIIQYVEKELNIYLNKLAGTKDVEYCVYSDTDSIYIELKPLLDKHFPGKEGIDRINLLDNIFNTTIQPKLSKICLDATQYVNAYRDNIIFKRELLADKAFWTAKKRYAVNVYDSEGVRYTKPKLKVVGLEVKKSNVPRICRDNLMKVVEIVMYKNESDIHKFIKEFKLEFMKCSPEAIARISTANGISKYQNATQGVPIHVAGALKFNEFITKNNLTKKYDIIKAGEKVKFVHLKQPNPYQSHVMAFVGKPPAELELEKWIDYNAQFEKAFIEPAKIMTTAVGWNIEMKKTLRGFLRKDSA